MTTTTWLLVRSGKASTGSSRQAEAGDDERAPGGAGTNAPLARARHATKPFDGPAVTPPPPAPRLEELRLQQEAPAVATFSPAATPERISTQPLAPRRGRPRASRSAPSLAPRRRRLAVHLLDRRLRAPTTIGAAPTRARATRAYISGLRRPSGFGTWQRTVTRRVFGFTASPTNVTCRRRSRRATRRRGARSAGRRRRAGSASRRPRPGPRARSGRSRRRGASRASPRSRR